MIEQFLVWWHRHILNHVQGRNRVTVGMFDSSQGWLIHCSCGKQFAL